MANVQTDFVLGNGTYVSRAVDTDGSAAVTVTLPTPQAGSRARIHRITASCSGANSAADKGVVVKLDGTTTNWRTYYAVGRGLLGDHVFHKPLIGKAATAVVIVLEDLDTGSCVGELEVVYDFANAS